MRGRFSCRNYETNRRSILIGGVFLLCLFVGNELELDAKFMSFASQDVKNKQSSRKKQEQVYNTTKSSPVRYCTWHPNNQECMDLLLRRNETGGPLVSYRNRRWAFIGDSTMKRLHNKLDKKVMDKASGPCKCLYKKLGRCNLTTAFGFEEPEQWIPPRPGLEGPIGYGLNHSNCNDCNGCASAFWECQMPCNYSSSAFYGLENARDVEIQTPTLKTSQEAVVQLHLQKTQQATEYPFTCVVNTGIHEMGIVGITTATILANIDWMLRVLRPVCHELIWIALADVLDEAIYPQRSSWIVEVNKALLEQIFVQEDFSDWLITVIDPFPASSTWEHLDNIHMNHTYYKSLGSLFEKLENDQGM